MFKTCTMKKILSMILAIMCVLSVFSITASAYSNGSSSNDVYDALIQKIKWTIVQSLSGINTDSGTVKNTTSVVYPSKVSLSRDSITINKGCTATISATVIPSDATDRSIRWSSSDRKVASVENGKIKGLMPGLCTIYAQASNGKTSACAVYVRGIAFSSPAAALYVGDKGTLKPKTCSVSSVMTWTSSDKSVVSVDSTGRVTAKKEGGATITVKTQDGYSASIAIFVRGKKIKESGSFGSYKPVTVRLNLGCDKGKIEIKCKDANGIDFNNDVIVTLKNKNGGQIWRGTVRSPSTLTLGNDHSEYVVTIERKNSDNPLYLGSTFEWTLKCTSNCHIV